MKINNDSPASIQARTEALKGAKDRVSLSKKAGDAATGLSEENVKVSLSDRAQDLLMAKKIAQNTPDVRPERVEQLKSMIKAGKYKIDSDAIANRMVDDALMDLT